MRKMESKLKSIERIEKPDGTVNMKLIFENKVYNLYNVKVVDNIEQNIDKINELSLNFIYESIEKIDNDKRKEILIDYAKSHFADLIPYDDPDYDKKLQKMAEDYANFEIMGDKDFEELCRLHDEMLEPDTNNIQEESIDINELFKQ